MSGIPIVGGSLRDSLGNAGQATGGNVVAAGRQGETAVNDTARVLGWVTFALPTLVLLAFFIPLRARQIRGLTAARRALHAVVGPERRRLLAMRAAFGLSWLDLRPYSADPIGDLEAGRLDRSSRRSMPRRACDHPPRRSPAARSDVARPRGTTSYTRHRLCGMV